MVPSPSSSGVGWLAAWPAGWPVASSAVCPPAWCAGQLGVARLAGWLRLRFAGCPPRGCFNGMGVAGRGQPAAQGRRSWKARKEGARRTPHHHVPRRHERGDQQREKKCVRTQKHNRDWVLANLTAPAFLCAQHRPYSLFSSRTGCRQV